MSRGDSPMPLHVGDFMASTADWPMEAKGAYLLLLAHQWAMGSVPSDPREVASLIGFRGEISGKKWGETWGRFRGKFADISPGRMANARLEQHRQAVEAKRQSNRERAAKGANGRWKRDASSIPPYQTIPIEEIQNKSSNAQNPEWTHPFPEAQPLSHPQRVEGSPEPQPLQLAIETSPPGRKNLSKPPIVPEVIDFLPGLNREAFEEWLTYRRKRKPAVNPASYPALMKKLVSYGDEQVQAATVENAIANGYQGLWELRMPVQQGRKTRVESALENLYRQINEKEGT
jgi:uncharacterized protein YdaU (DUF1376 family)